LIEAKRQLLSDIKDMDLSVEVPHIPEGSGLTLHRLHRRCRHVLIQ